MEPLGARQNSALLPSQGLKLPWLPAKLQAQLLHQRFAF
jgi:hypothetical protein